MKLVRSMLKTRFDHPVTVRAGGTTYQGAQIVSVSKGVVSKLWIRYQDEDLFFEEGEIEEMEEESD